METSNSLISVHTVSEKKTNEDYVAGFRNDCFNGIVVGDGIGSHYKSELGARFCVEQLVKLLNEPEDPKNVDFKKLFEEIYEGLKEEFKADDDIAVPNSMAYGTTLICALEFDDKFVVAYVGNGSIWHLRGNYPELISPQRYLPWSALNLLNAHSTDFEGKEALYKFFALEAPPEQIVPSVIQIEKDDVLFGDVLIVSTDGLYSCDQVPVAKDAEGGLWLGGESKMELLFHALKEFSTKDTLTNEVLDEILSDYTNEIKNKKMLDDDTSFGVMYSGKTIEYLKNKDEADSNR